VSVGSHCWPPAPRSGTAGPGAVGHLTVMAPATEIAYVAIVVIGRVPSGNQLVFDDLTVGS
jgi:hypothetical protein